MGQLKVLLSLLIGLLIFGCAKGVDMSSTATDSTVVSLVSVDKSLFSLWMDTNGTVAIDLRQAVFSSLKPLTITTVTQQNCNCQVLIQGQPASGTMQVSSCSGNLSNGALTCASFVGTAQYTLTNGLLKFCQGVIGCLNFQ
jgi:hypothetical protein